jgi:hypothetical protein
MTELPNEATVNTPRLTIKELWEKSDAITRNIINNPKKHPVAFAKMVWSGDYIPQPLQKFYDRLNRIRP